MPLFMDRHDLPGISAEEVAQAHLTDIQFESKYGVKFLAYWFDAEHGQVFCLARATRPEDLAAVHRDGHGLVPNEIIAPFWALAHPLQAWKVFLPDPNAPALGKPDVVPPPIFRWGP